MRLNRNVRQHRGATSMVEAIGCITITSILLVVLVMLMSYTNSVSIETQQAVNHKNDVDFFIEMLQVDVKSSVQIELSDNQLTLVQKNSIVIYRITDGAVWRNTEVAVANILSGMFVPADGDSVGVYLRYGDTEVIEITLSR